MAGSISDVSDATFSAEVLDAAEPVLVDFWAPRCGPCEKLAPTFDALSKEYAGRVKFAKVNTDQARQPAMQYGIEGIPTLLLFKNGTVVDRITGLQSKDRLSAMLDQHLKA